jgi:hypothetical protein
MTGNGDEHASVHRRYEESELGTFVDSTSFTKTSSWCNHSIKRVT